MNFMQPGWTQAIKGALFRSLSLVSLACAMMLWIASSADADSRDSDKDRRRGNNGIELRFVGRHQTGILDGAAAESLSYDPRTKRVFVVNVADASIDVISIKTPSQPTRLFAIDVTPFGSNANSVAVHNGIVAVAVENNVKTDPGMAVFFNTDGILLNAVQVGALPDMITFTPDGEKVLVANEGEPNSYNQPDSVDPEGSVSIIDISRGVRRLRQSDVTTANFRRFNDAKLDSSIRIFGPNASVAQDLEPEYIAVSKDSKEAWVTLQENNAIAHLDISRGRFTKLIGLGFKDHNQPGNEFDASDRDNTINIANWPVRGFYLPDAIASYEHKGKTYLVTANEGDARDWPGFAEEERVEDITLDPKKFPNAAELQEEGALGRLNITIANGNTDNDEEFEALYALGGRSFSIWTESGKLVFDSGADFEKITADIFPNDFNSDNAENQSFDTRSDNKGPEPEGVTVARLFGRVYAFISLERIGGLMVYDITDPFKVSFEAYLNTRNFSVPETDPLVGDLGPEVTHVVEAEDSPSGKPLLVVAHEVSGTTTVYEIVKKKPGQNVVFNTSAVP
jgi:2',3'-cyclic-nucleotide 2'-phosphodiesterase / 3'-nucleotidase / 5'-nucleotidase